MFYLISSRLCIYLETKYELLYSGAKYAVFLCLSLSVSLFNARRIAGGGLVSGSLIERHSTLSIHARGRPVTAIERIEPPPLTGFRSD